VAKSWGLRLGTVLMRAAGRTAGVLVIVLAAVGLIGLAAFESVDEAVCDYDDRSDGCTGPEWISIAVFVAALVSWTLAVLLLPLWLVHVAERRRHRRNETLHTPRLHSLDGWLMAGQVPADRHDSLNGDLRRLIGHDHPAQLARHAAACLVAFCMMLALLGLAGAAIGGMVVADQDCLAKRADCGHIAILTGIAWFVAAVGAFGFILGTVGGAAARRSERQAWEGFEQAWNRTLQEGARATRGAIQPKPRPSRLA
jgi:hypothetical protein